MAFGGAVTTRGAAVAADGNFKNLLICEVAADALGIGTGAFNLANVDSGRFTTDTTTTPANTTAMGSAAQMAQWGKGEGLWAANDQWRVLAAYHHLAVAIQDAATGDIPNPQFIARAHVAGTADISFDFYNAGGQVTGAMIFQFLYCWIGS